MSDALASVAVIIDGPLIILCDLRRVDPVITICIAIYILYSALNKIGNPIRMLMLGSPPDMDVDAVVEAITDIESVQNVHHVQLRQMQEHEVAFDCHVALVGRDWADLEAVKQAIKKKLADDFNISHSSLKFETSVNAHTAASLLGHKGGKNAAEYPGG